MNWFYKQPVSILFKTGGLKDLGEELEKLGYRKGLLVCTSYFVKNGKADEVVKSTQGKITAVFSDITPNPLVTQADSCAKILSGDDFDFVLALGGGSALDLAKAACAVAANGGGALDYLTGKRTVVNPTLPLIAVPTTAGTGTEATCVAVLSEPALGLKAPMFSDYFYPKLVIIDPELTLTVPPNVTAATGMDALSHALEGFWSRNHQPICDALALRAVRLIFRYLERTYDDGSDLEAREKMCEASVLAGMTFSLPKTAASHACSFPLTSVCGLPHGEACAFTLDSLCHINADAENGRLNDFARDAGFSGAAAMGDEITRLKKHMAMPCTLAEIGLRAEDLPEFVQKCKHPNLLNNPVEMDDDALLRMFKSKAD
ncbi:MAG: iron-containing alcohol dehydrogenase family protein [Oscillospiraceae bacterium]|nr:iron-containing alcohol dehydrogenase family protein [Oscillospiraceae bacterium]